MKPTIEITYAHGKATIVVTNKNNVAVAKKLTASEIVWLVRSLAGMLPRKAVRS